MKLNENGIKNCANKIIIGRLAVWVLMYNEQEFRLHRSEYYRDDKKQKLARRSLHQLLLSQEKLFASASLTQKPN